MHRQSNQAPSSLSQVCRNPLVSYLPFRTRVQKDLEHPVHTTCTHPCMPCEYHCRTVLHLILISAGVPTITNPYLPTRCLIQHKAPRCPFPRHICEFSVQASMRPSIVTDMSNSPQRSHTLSSLPDLPSSLYQNSQTPSMSPHSLDTRDNVRLVHSRPKPQCWEHGCNGRQFSTFSNLLRHQREKSGVATKSSCPNCGAEFTRTTARNGHMAHDKCKPRRAS